MNAEPEKPEGREPLPMWMVYDHLEDYPHNFVARQSFVERDGSTSYGAFVITPRLDWLRRWLKAKGLICLARDPRDDPKIVEVWL